MRSLVKNIEQKIYLALRIVHSLVKNIDQKIYLTLRIVRSFEVNVLAHFWTIKVLSISCGTWKYNICCGTKRKKVNSKCCMLTKYIQAFLPDMLDQKMGHVVTIASLAGQAGTNKLVSNSVITIIVIISIILIIIPIIMIVIIASSEDDDVSDSNV